MIWGETYKQERARRAAIEPHPWFAWHPVVLSDGRCAWLSTVTRRRANGFDWWVYEAPVLTTQPNRGGDTHD